MCCTFNTYSEGYRRALPGILIDLILKHKTLFLLQRNPGILKYCVRCLQITFLPDLFPPVFDNVSVYTHQKWRVALHHRSTVFHCFSVQSGLRQSGFSQMYNSVSLHFCSVAEAFCVKSIGRMGSQILPKQGQANETNVQKLGDLCPWGRSTFGTPTPPPRTYKFGYVIIWMMQK